MLDLKSISKTFNAGTVNEKTALNNLCLHLNDGDFVTVIGGNGAGKSTMLNAVAGAWPVDEGTGFGGRKAPKKGASTNHKGIDWATPIGTAVMASSGGTVTRAGWGSGYGYVVYIQHADGRETRYGHLSKVLVSVGQKVSQGQKIALSGNTGRSTGPHLHFEIRINGQAVNPLNYLN